jgi:hypothetical protein
MRIISQKFASMSHEVVKFPIYEPGKNPYKFKKGEEDKVMKKYAVANDTDIDIDIDADANLDDEEKELESDRNALEAFFELCKTDANARQYTFLKVNQYYLFEKSGKNGNGD